jgi:GT2 family glycosyltransferase
MGIILLWSGSDGLCQDALAQKSIFSSVLRDMKKNQIAAVVVLYKRLPEQSQTIDSLGKVFAGNPVLLDSVRVILFDNSPKALDQVNLSFPCDYHHPDRNVGTSGAYNYAMELAEAEQCPWLLLLDQDTTVSAEFLPRMLEYSRDLGDSSEVGSVVPLIYSHGSLVSPRKHGRFNQISLIPTTFRGVYRHKAFAVNSATLMRVTALREIGGYSDDFWLDLSDVYVFQAMYRKGRYIYIAGDLTLNHSITSMDFDKDMAPERYRNFLAAESAYVDLYSSAPERAFHLIRLMARTLRQRRRHRNRAFADMTLEYLCRRLFDTRATRIRSWRKQLLLRDIPVVEEGQVVG